MDHTTPTKDKRRFTRVAFISHITLSHNQQHWQGDVIDISFNGILINFELTPELDKNILFNAVIHFENGVTICADIQLAHHHDKHYGFCFTQIDSDSLTHLLNIISHNLGNVQACERELMCLFDSQG
jgi:hypothetical protein